MGVKKLKGSEYLKYSGLAFQMFIILLAGWFIGSRLDAYFNLAKPAFTLLFTVLFIVVYFIKLIRDLSKRP